MANIYKTRIDIKNVTPNFKPVFVQYDHAKLEIEMTDNGKIYNLSNVERVEFTHIRGDDTVIIQAGEIVTDGNKQVIRYEYQGSEMDVVGTIKTSFAIFDANNKKVSSHAFEVSIVKDLRDETFEPAKPNYGLLQTLINDVEYIKENGSNVNFTGETITSALGYTPANSAELTELERVTLANKPVIVDTPEANERQAYLTFTDDDGKNAVWSKLKPLSEELGIPFALGVVSSFVNSETFLTGEQLRYLQNNLGWEINNHSHTHENLRVFTEQQVEADLLECNRILRGYGLDVKNFIAPFGSNDTKHVRKVANKYFNCSFKVGDGINLFPVQNQLIKRIALGAFTAPGENTLEFYKNQVDKAITAGGWLVFMTHCAAEEHTEQQNQFLRETILYAQSLGVKIVNAQEGFEKFGNIVEVEGKMSIGRDGEIFTSSLQNRWIKSSDVTEINYLTTPREAFAKFPNTLVSSYYPFSDIQNFPGSSAGTLLTYTFGTAAMTHQEWRPYLIDDVYRRRSANDSGTEWGAWSRLAPI